MQVDDERLAVAGIGQAEGADQVRGVDAAAPPWCPVSGPNAHRRQPEVIHLQSVDLQVEIHDRRRCAAARWQRCQCICPGGHVQRPEAAVDTDAISIVQGGRVPAESHVNACTVGTELRGHLVSI